MRLSSWRFACACCAGWILVSGAVLSGASEDDVRTLIEQNRQLTQQIGAQQKQIDELRARLDHLQPDNGAEPSPGPGAENGRQIRLSGEAGLAYFHSGREGNFPNAEFRVDEAKLFLEAPIWKNVYFFGGMDLVLREANDEYFHVGELYVDVENLFSAGRHQTLSLRAGRFNLPFGEEYQVRNVVDNPLISHSLSDIWGIDEGVQLYGSLGRVKYNLAVQNGGHKTLHDSNSDKAVTMRLAFEAAPSLRLSASALRTGKLDAANDGLSEVWFANGFFRPLGPAATTKTFSAQLFEVDAVGHWRSGQVKAMAGWGSFDDDNTAADDSRHLNFYSIEASQRLAGDLSGAIRLSGIRAPNGYPLAGQGNVGKYFYNPFGPLTTSLQRLSLGLNYRFDPSLVWKMEYSRETGKHLDGTKRRDTDSISTLLGMKF